MRMWLDKRLYAEAAIKSFTTIFPPHRCLNRFSSGEIAVTEKLIPNTKPTNRPYTTHPSASPAASPPYTDS